MLPNSADGVYFNELIDPYAKRCRQSKRGVGRTISYNLRRLRSYFEHLPAQLTKHQLSEFAHIRLASGVKPPTLPMDFNLIRTIAKHAFDYLDLGIDLRPFSAVQATLLADGHIGRPKDEFKVAELARSYTVEAVETLVDLMRYSKDDRVRGTASQALLVRCWGKAKLEVVPVGGQSYIEALQAAAEVIKLRSAHAA